MMSPDDQIAIEARLTAIEHMACTTYNLVLAMMALDEETISAFEYRSLLRMDQQATDRSDPLVSDHDGARFLDALQSATVSLRTYARELRENAAAAKADD